MTRKFPTLSCRLPSGRALAVIFLLLALTTLVQAQQPIAELGSWPPGALTLLVGLWLAVQSIIGGDFDATPSLCIRPLIHLIPGLKVMLWSREPMGTIIKSLVFSNCAMPQGVPTESKIGRHDVHDGIWEWDILTIYNREMGRVPQPNVSVPHTVAPKVPQFELIEGNKEEKSEKDDSPTVVSERRGEENGDKVESVSPVKLAEGEAGKSKSSSGVVVSVERRDDPEEECRFKMTIKTPESSNLDVHLTFTVLTSSKDPHSELSNVHSTLWEALGKPNTDKFLQYWRCLQAYQSTRTLHHMLPKNSKARDIDTSNLPEEQLPDLDDNETLQIFIGNPPNHSNEAVIGAFMQDKALKVKHLMALLRYVKIFPKPLYANPLVPLLWWWVEGKAGEQDNMFFTLPEIKIQETPTRPGPYKTSTVKQPTFRSTPKSPTATRRPKLLSWLWARDYTEPNIEAPVVPTASNNITPAPTFCEIELLEGIPVIDGSDFFGFARFPWIVSTIFGIVITFFTAIAGTSNPNLATAIGLLVLRPYSNDNNYRDAGVPPSWNGRRQIRWGDYRCGIFNGPTQVRVGNIGNSIYRFTILMAVAWLTWYWRAPLRDALSFKEIQAVQPWVMWVAFLLEAISTVWIFIGTWILYSWEQYRIAVAAFITGVAEGCVAGLMLWYLLTGHGLKAIFFAAEACLGTAALYGGLTVIGAESNSGAIQLGCLIFWAHMVAVSCFQWN